MLSQGDWKRLEDLFHLACEKPPEQREAFAREQAWDHLELLDELLAMLAMESSATAAVHEPLRNIGNALQSPALLALESGARLGPWQVDRLIGSGGMGQVYLGHRADGAYEREVAIKTIGANGLSAQLRAYFEFERQALAQMQHPAIAQIIDAGSGAQDQLYLVMEYVQGQPLAAWCESHKLSLRERVQLFLRVCEGVQHAHQKGVIHRDLKPGNVLIGEVDGKPAPKIIDFGIAAETSGNHASPVGTSGTPGYMSPEQAQPGMDVDSRSDVYSLGAILFELVSGKRPRGTKPGNSSTSEPVRPSQQISTLSPAEIEALAEHCSTQPGHLIKTVHDDLDWIVVKAMQYDREARYGSVSALIDDLHRWLDGYLPRAAPYRRWHALRKFVARNRMGVAAAALVFITILGGLIATSWALHRANQAAERARVTSEFLGSLLTSVDPALSADLDKTLMRKVLDEASTRVAKELADQPEARADVELTIAYSYFNLGDIKRSTEHLESALHVSQAEIGRYSVQALRAMQELGNVLTMQGQLDRAEAMLREALPHAEKLRDEQDPIIAPRTKSRLGWLIRERGRPQEALPLLRDAYETLSKTVSPLNPRVIDAGQYYAIALSDVGQLDEAIALMKDLISRRIESLGADHPQTMALRNSLADFLVSRNDYAGAERELKSLIESAARQPSVGPMMLPILHVNLGSALHAQNTPEKMAEAGEHLKLAVEAQVARFGPEKPNSIRIRHSYASWQLDNGQVVEAHEELRTLLDICLRAYDEKFRPVAGIYLSLAQAELALGHLDDAHVHAERALALQREAYGEDETRLRDALQLLEKIKAAQTLAP
ncbi:MAG: serine/threonine-protein kinase [Lysobacteraceae bacterium]